MGRDQLDRLAAELREQLEQEHTSLMASIEEMQGLIEAEVDGGVPRPSIADLEAFASQVDVLMRSSGGSDGDRPRSQAEVATGRQRAAVSEEAPPGIPEAAAESVEEAAEPEAAEAALVLLPHSPARAPPRPASALPARPRWADMGSDSDEAREAPSKPVAVSLATSSASAGGAPAQASCSKCLRLLGRAAFSRRAWRQARGLGGGACRGELHTAGGGHGAVCITCSGGSNENSLHRKS